jgi:hypothetical protein
MTLAPKVQTANNLQQFFWPNITDLACRCGGFASSKLVPNFEILLQKW